MIVTIVEIHRLIIDVCVSLKKLKKEEKLLRNYFEYIVNIKNILYKVTAAIINKVHLTQKLDST